MLERVIPGSNVRMRILSAILENPGINLNELIRKVKTSPNIVLSYANELMKNNVLKEEIHKGMERVHMRRLYPNLSSELCKQVFALVEADKTKKFLGKYPKFKPLCEQINLIADKEIDFILIYGSYARLAATKESDIDVLAVGHISKEKITRIKEVFVTSDAELSLKAETPKKFKDNMKKPLYVSIMKEHIIISGYQNFLDFLDK